MMNRPLALLLLTLPVTAVLTAGYAQAQSSPTLPPPGFSGANDRVVTRNSQSDPLQSLFAPLFQSANHTDPSNPRRVDSEDLPPPGFATPDGGAPAVGYQFADQLPAAGAPAAVETDPNAIRPPAVVGAKPNGVPPPVPSTSVMTLPPEEQPEQGQPKELPPNLKKQLVDFTTKEPAGTIIIDTPNTYLYLVLGGGKALRYGIGVGREGFTWSGTERISKMKEWPDWHPPTEMIERQPYLPRFMAGGPGNPLGARALYLGKTLYRIHGTNQPSTIGQTVSSGCIRLLNADIEDLFSRVQVGSRVVVLPGKVPETIANNANSSGVEPADPMEPPPRTGTAIFGEPLPSVR
jgi:lipoprotein-anchoring transpeptidase ErfK/SrfK